MKTKKKEKEEETIEKYCSLKVPIEHTDKESMSYTVKVKRYDSGPPEEFLKWRLKWWSRSRTMDMKKMLITV
jgi:hypothetical protein